MQFLWGNFDRQTSVYLWRSQGRSIRGSDVRGKNEICQVGGHASVVSHADAHSILFCSAGILGVLGVTSVCESASLDLLHEFALLL
jgi:hypothetical protein